ncbi:hypothetical protein [Pseudoduganella sp. OTU4001]|uniref:hypothetical protein n=1 Tax=Pseudoduganella sp. OTU4001 TaxID=3043854 RepID=UPI00313AE7DE
MPDFRPWKVVASLACCHMASMSLWSFIMGIAHGASFLLTPALMTLCGAGGLLVQTLVALGLHLLLMLASGGALLYLAARIMRVLKA